MFRVDVTKVEELAAEARLDMQDIAADNDRDIMIYLHWTAGHYGQYFDDYHINIDEDGGIYLSTDDFSRTKAHTWRRNSAAVGIALCCCYEATPKDLGEEPPTEQQIDSMARVVAALCKGFQIPCDADHVLTHAEAADEDGYGLYDDDPDCRWDLLCIDESGENGGDIIREKANKYMEA